MEMMHDGNISTIVSTFRMDLELSCSCDLKLSEINLSPKKKSCNNSTNRIYLLKSLSIQIYREGNYLDGVDSTHHIGLFIPFSIVSFIDVELYEEEKVNCEACSLRRINTLQKISFLSKIHPCFVYFEITAIILVESNVDLLIIDVGDANIISILDEVNGEGIVTTPNRVIKALPLSFLNFEVSSREGRIPSCPVCLHRIDPLRLGLLATKERDLCTEHCIGNSCENIFTCPWPSPNHCNACHTISLYENMGFIDRSCYECNLTETLWVCLTCAVVGCGRYSRGHADKHYRESGHAYSLELATQRIWDYPADGYAQRIDLLKCPSKSIYISLNSSNEEADSCFNDSTILKKTFYIGEEYNCMLQSALEDQAQHYETEISRLHAELSAEYISSNTLTIKEAPLVDSLKKDINNLRLESNSIQLLILDKQAQKAFYKATCQSLLQQQQDSKQELTTIQNQYFAIRKSHEQIKEELEQKIHDLTTNLRMRNEISKDEEMKKAQIVFAANIPNQKKMINKKTRRKNNRRSST